MRSLKIFLVGVAALIATLFSTFSAAANSLGVEPLFLEIRPGQSAAIRVNNNSDENTPVEVYVKERLVDASGVQTRVEADDAFIVFPPQAVVPPSSTQVFRLQPIDKAAGESKSYYVSIRQLPVDLGDTPEGGARVQVVFAFDAAVHVIPRGTKAKPIVESAVPSQMDVTVATGRYENDEFGEPREVMETKTVPAVKITMNNTGSRYLYLQDQDYTVTGTALDGSKLDIPKWGTDEILKAVSVVLLQPGATRTFSLPLPAGTQPKELSVSVKERR